MNQETVQNQVLEKLGAPGQSKLYPDLLEAIDPMGRQYLPGALRNLRNSGQITKVVKRNPDNGTIDHVITRTA